MRAMATPSRPRKRGRDDEEEFTDIASISPTKTGKVHGYVQALSLMKQNASGTSKYFTCEVTDRQTHRRAVGFDSKVHQKLACFYNNKVPVAIGNCQIKESLYSSNLEVIICNSSVLENHPLMFLLMSINQKLNLEDLPQLANFLRVTVKIKVIAVHDTVRVKNLTK